MAGGMIQCHESSNDLASFATLASDSSPFHEKYYFDEDGEILGEVSFSVKYAATIRTVEICHGFSLMSK